MIEGLLVVIALAAAAASVPLLARQRGRAREMPSSFVRDPGRDVRAERRARQLLRDAAGPAVASMYEHLGFVAIEGQAGPGREAAESGYGFLIYPHRPIVAYDAESGELLSEYCVRFPDGSEPMAGEWLPDADDVLAKWMALLADERRLIDAANMHLPGRQLDPTMVRRDLVALGEWRRSRMAEVAA
jgi:hypothetical protein